MLYLRQSTASQAVLIGPFVDTDGAAVTGLTIDAADIRLSKNGGNIAGKNSGGATHDELGMYTITLDATDTDTVGRLQLIVAETGALTVYHEYQVVEEAIFDSLYASSALPSGVIARDTAQSGTGTTIVLASGTSFADDILIGATINIVSGTGVGQRRLITDYTGASDTCTVDTWVTNPDNTSVYEIYATAPASGGGSGPSAADIADAVWDEDLSGHTSSGTAGQRMGRIPNVAAGSNGGLPTVDGSNRVTALISSGTAAGQLSISSGLLAWNAAWDAEVQSECADALNAYDPPTRAELTSDIGTVIADTEDIQSRIPASLNNGCIAADVQRINDTEVVGNGTEGNKWRA